MINIYIWKVSGKIAECKLHLYLTFPSHIFGVGRGHRDGWMAKLGFHATGFEDSFGVAFVESRRQIFWPLRLWNDIDKAFQSLAMQQLDLIAKRPSSDVTSCCWRCAAITG